MSNQKYLLFRSIIGSRLYQTHNEESDYDYFEVTAPKDKRSLFLLGSTESGIHKIEGDNDVTSHEIRGFIKRAMKGESIFIECLYAKPEHVWCSDLFFSIYQNRDLFFPSQPSLVGASYGFATSELRRATGETNGEAQERRLQEIDQFGYDKKALYNCLRITAQSLSALNKGIFSPYPIDHGGTFWLAFLKEVKTGRMPKNMALDMAKDLIERLGKFFPIDRDGKQSNFDSKIPAERLAQGEELICDLLLRLSSRY